MSCQEDIVQRMASPQTPLDSEDRVNAGCLEFEALGVIEQVRIMQCSMGHGSFRR